MDGVCELDYLDTRLKQKIKSLDKHYRIVESLKEDVINIESKKRFLYFQIMNGRGVY